MLVKLGIFKESQKEKGVKGNLDLNTFCFCGETRILFAGQKEKRPGLPSKLYQMPIVPIKFPRVPCGNENSWRVWRPWVRGTQEEEHNCEVLEYIIH